MNNRFLRYVLSPLLVSLSLVGIELVSRYEWFTVSLALPVGVLSLCLFWSGLRANILSAMLITTYTLYSSGLDPSRTIQLILTVWPVAIGGGLLKHWLIESVREAERQRLRAEDNQAKADAYDTLNGNIDTLKKLARRLSDLTNGWELLNDKARMGILEEVQGGLVNLAQKVVGWHEIAKEKKSLEE